METIKIRNRTEDFTSYRAARVKSLFNAETGSQFNFDVDVDLSGDWTIGVVVGPSGSGKTSIGNVILNGCGITDLYEGWDNTKPIVDCIAPGGDFNDVTGALANVGLGDAPTEKQDEKLATWEPSFERQRLKRNELIMLC